jgi:hypothetical protein
VLTRGLLIIDVNALLEQLQLADPDLFAAMKDHRELMLYK